MYNEAKKRGSIRAELKTDFFDQDKFIQTLNELVEKTAQLDPETRSSITFFVEHSGDLPPVTDPTDVKILEWVTKDPDTSDTEIGQRLGISRQAVNQRRRKLEEMGYQVR